MNAIERSLSVDETVSPSPRFAENIMAEVRAAARPARSTFPWRWLALRLVTYLSLAVAAVAVATEIDMSILTPVAAYLMTTIAILLTAWAAIRAPRFSSDAG